MTKAAKAKTKAEIAAEEKRNNQNYWKIKSADGVSALEKGTQTGIKESDSKFGFSKPIYTYKTALKDLTLDDVQKIRNELTALLKPQCEDFHESLSKNTIFCMKQIVGVMGASGALQKVAYHADNQEFAVTNGYVLLVDRHSKSLFDKNGTFDILKLGNKETPVRELKWIDDGFKYPDYNKIIPEYENTIEFKDSFALFSVVKIAYEQTKKSEEYGTIVLGKTSYYFTSHYESEKVNIGINIPGLITVQFNAAYLYWSLMFLLESHQSIVIKQNNEMQMTCFETNDKKKSAYIMPIKP